jgi:hypothetical protein
MLLTPLVVQAGQGTWWETRRDINSYPSVVFPWTGLEQVPRHVAGYELMDPPIFLDLSWQYEIHRSAFQAGFRKDSRITLFQSHRRIQPWRDSSLHNFCLPSLLPFRKGKSSWNSNQEFLDLRLKLQNFKCSSILLQIGGLDL